MAFASELQARERKLAREQKERQEKARNKLESIRKAQEAAQARRAAEEEVQRARRLAEAAQEEEKRLQWEADVAANQGVSYDERLDVELLEPGVAEARGIRRSKDKVLLPPSAKFDLLRHGVDRLGSLLFEITADDGSRTHAGLLDFTAPQGKVCLPRDVLRSLTGNMDPAQVGTVRVRYVKLPGGEFAKLQPMEKAFQQVDDIKAGLEGALLTRCTLTEGDIVSVSDGETLHDLRVLELKPESAISIVETDLEVDIAPSVETEEEIQRLEEAKIARKEQIRKENEEEEFRAEQEKQAAEALKKEEALKQQEREERWERLSQALPPEPTPGPDVTTVLVRTPDGTRKERRFLRSDRISLLFHFVDSGPCGGAEPGGYNLVMLYPKRVFTLSGDGCTTLHEAGITGRQESLLIEIVKDHQ